jgi:hypothetical protein
VALRPSRSHDHPGLYRLAGCRQGRCGLQRDSLLQACAEVIEKHKVAFAHRQAQELALGGQGQDQQGRDRMAQSPHSEGPWGGAGGWGWGWVVCLVL